MSVCYVRCDHRNTHISDGIELWLLLIPGKVRTQRRPQADVQANRRAAAMRIGYTYCIDHLPSGASLLNVIYPKRLDAPNRVEVKLCAELPSRREFGNGP